MERGAENEEGSAVGARYPLVRGHGHGQRQRRLEQLERRLERGVFGELIIVFEQLLLGQDGRQLVGRKREDVGREPHIPARRLLLLFRPTDLLWRDRATGSPVLQQSRHRHKRCRRRGCLGFSR